MLEEFKMPKHGAKDGLREVDLNQGMVADLLDDLSGQDALFITEESSFERCEELARGFLQLHPKQRAKLVDALAANLHALSTSAQSLLSKYEDTCLEVILQHQNGFKMLVYLLHVIAMKVEKDSQQVKGTENAAKPKAGRGRKAAAAVDDDDDGWDWQQLRQRVLLSVRELMLVDLEMLFKGLVATEQLVNLCMELALQGLECATVAKQDAWPACRDVLVIGAVKYKQLEFTASALFERARQHDHLPELVALLAKFAEEKHNSTQLGVNLLLEFCHTAPEEYDLQYGTNSTSVRRAGEVLSHLAELLPKVVSNNISQLQPYLGCAKASTLRGAVLEAVGSVLVKVFPIENFTSSLGEGAAAAHARSKQALLTLLHERVLDKGAFVRQRVMQVWARLVERECVPLPQWNSLLAQAIGRLEDESQLVVKAALQLMYKMVEQSIFKPPLTYDIYLNTLRLEEARLAELLPQEGQEAEAEGDAGARWEQGAIQIGEAEQSETPDGDEQPSSTAGGSSRAASIQRQRLMVSSLKEGVSFCKRLTAALQQLQVLLANPAATVVHQAIAFLTLCMRFDVSGASKALRGVWPLVFSKHEPVRQSVLDSWHILHLHEKRPAQQLDELIGNVIPGSSLAELTALESIIGSLVQQGALPAGPLMMALVSKICHVYAELEKLPPTALQQAVQQQQQHSTEHNDAIETDVAEAVPGPEQQAAAAAAALLCKLRNAFTLLSMLTAAQPSVLDHRFLPVLLEVGFSGKLGDAWLARHTCLAFRYASAHLTPASSTQAAAAQQLSRPAVAAVNSRVAGTGNDALEPDMLQDMLAAIVRLLVAPPPSSMEANWPSAAEAGIGALYALSPQPQELMARVLREMHMRCKPGNCTDPAASNFGYSAAALSRFFFALGRTALQHLLCIEQIGKAIRAARLAADRAAAEAADRQREAAAAGGRKASAKGQQQQQDDIGALLGVGSVADDAALDALAEMVEAQVLAKDELLGTYGQLLSRFCYQPTGKKGRSGFKTLLSAPQDLQASALLALTQLMAVDARFCSDNVAVMFTLLVNKHVCTEVRVNMVVSLADLASRFPNVLEPWMHCFYEPLKDPQPAVKLAALTSLTHLVLGGMVKAKGNVAKVAALLVDDSPEIIDRAVLFFESLAKTGSGSTRSASAAAGASAANPVYNLLPDCLSALLKDERLREEQLQVIMGQLLAYVKDKQADSLRERLVGRLAAGGPREWRTVAWCIGQLGYTEKGLRRMIELTPGYRHALGEQQVFDVFMGLADKARRSTGGSKAAAAAESASQGLAGAQGELRTAVEEWVVDLEASRGAAIEAAEVEAAEEARRQQQQQQHAESAVSAETAAAESEETSQAQAEQPAAAAEGSGEQRSNCMNEQQQEPAANEAAAAGGSSSMTSGTDGLADGSGVLGDAEPAAAPAAAAAEDTADDVDAKSDSSDAEDEQIVLMQSQDVADLDDAGDAAEAAAAAVRLNRLSLAASRPISAAATPAAALTGRRSQRKGTAAGAVGANTATRAARPKTGTAAAGCTATGRRGCKAAGVAARGAGKASRKEYSGSEESHGSSSSADDDNDSDVSSGSGGDDDATAGDQQPAASRGRGNRASAAAAGKRAAMRRSSTQQQQERFFPMEDSEDDD